MLINFQIKKGSVAEREGGSVENYSSSIVGGPSGVEYARTPWPRQRNRSSRVGTTWVPRREARLFCSRPAGMVNFFGENSRGRSWSFEVSEDVTDGWKILGGSVGRLVICGYKLADELLLK